MKQDLYNALRLIKDYCDSIDDCRVCEIKQECNENLQFAPETWDLEEE